MLKDMLCVPFKSFPKATGLKIPAFIIMGTKLTLLLMDRPAPYICRMTRCRPMFYPSSLDSFADDMGSLISLINQVKHVVKNTHNAVIRKELVGAVVDDSLLDDSSVKLSPCPRSPIKSNKRQRLL
ncbi:predicted protein [Lichtheimia corymbifera JMRC:FSU:9682]|uniref:Uncharacterized protein n=1 Tax=Lichtheimia corymbifera JMRC:FSU:9682 TaxID=1263082 RepID=A0A068SEC8_9FUNG|nr:predicted protein [Lichtheimia corymbifera JMRC:FSU:9682]CDH59601.1 predicted protein [Lichtheimia corymbifera JMRC:FSU:9682]